MKYLFLISLMTSSFFALSQDEPPSDPSVNYEYQKYQKFDLGNLAIKGNILTPGDVSVRDRLPSSIVNDVFNRKDFNDNMNKDIQDIK